MSGLADRLAREAVALSLGQDREALIAQVAAAIREALTEAAKVAREEITANGCDDHAGKYCDMNCVGMRRIAAAIEALK